MKKIYTLILALGAVTLSFGQSQRLVLFEEFTGETCPPCAVTNPGLNALLNANPLKVVSIKYMNDIPTPGPQLYQFNIPDVEARQAFYANNYSPNGILDGNQYNDQPATLTQGDIDTRWAMSSSFAINATHYFSAANDTIFTQVVIKAAQAITNMTMLKAHIVVIERNIYGYTSPNGENHFEGVMRKMLPTNAGTVLQANWNVNDSLVIDQSWKIGTTTAVPPDYIQLGIIAFVQNTANKEVLQTGYSRPQLPLDPLALSLSLPNIICQTNNVAPVVDVLNNGMLTLTSFDIEYKIDNGTTNIYSWSGSLASGLITAVTLPGLPVTLGSHTYSITITNPNSGGTDLDPNNNDASGAFAVPVSPVASNVAESFLTTSFPPLNWLRYNPDNGYTWTRVIQGAFGTQYSAKVDFYNSPGGQNDNLYVFPIDMTSAGNPTLTFDLAHKRYSTAYTDQLNVKVSTDCGATWTTVWSKSGAALATVTGYQTTAYVPAVTDWRNESVSLSLFAGQPDVLIVFNAVSGFGNNAFIDNINIDLSTGINENYLSKYISVYPNPSDGKIYMDVNFDQAKDVKVEIFNLVGEKVSSMDITNTVGGIYPVDLTALANGSYVVKITADSETLVQPLQILQ